MSKNKGLGIERMMRNYIIPHLNKKLDTTEELSNILSDEQINQIDSIYAPAEAIRKVNKAIKTDILTKTPDQIMNGEFVTPEQQEMMMGQEQQAIQQGLSQMGNQRFIKPSDIDGVTWKEVLKDVEWEVEVDVTGESKDKQGIMSTLSNVLKTIATNPTILTDPKVKLVFNKILEETGAISMLELNSVNSAPAIAPALAPQQIPAQI